MQQPVDQRAALTTGEEFIVCSRAAARCNGGVSELLEPSAEVRVEVKLVGATGGSRDSEYRSRFADVEKKLAKLSAGIGGFTSL